MPSVSGIEPLPKPPQCVLCHIHAKAGIVKCHAPQAEGLSHVANVHILAGPKGSKSLLEHLPHFPGCVAELFQCQLHNVDEAFLTSSSLLKLKITTVSEF